MVAASPHIRVPRLWRELLSRTKLVTFLPEPLYACWHIEHGCQWSLISIALGKALQSAIGRVKTGSTQNARISTVSDLTPAPCDATPMAQERYHLGIYSGMRRSDVAAPCLGLLGRTPEPFSHSLAITRVSRVSETYSSILGK